MPDLVVNDTTPGAANQPTLLERENPIPEVAANLAVLYEEPLTTRERHLGLMALGQRRDNWD